MNKYHENSKMNVSRNSPGFVGDVACIAEFPVAFTAKPPYIKTMPLPL